MLIIITGNGKGKTTSAIGQGIRALGQGKRVAMFQFIKSKVYPSGEDEILPKVFGKKFIYKKGGRGFVGILGDKLPRKVHKEAAEKTLKWGTKAIGSKKYDLVILDEIWVALYLKLITKSNIRNLIKRIPENMDIILTGRHAPEEFIKKANLVTECREIKHPYSKGAKAKKGVEY